MAEAEGSLGLEAIKQARIDLHGTQRGFAWTIRKRREGKEKMAEIKGLLGEFVDAFRQLARVVERGEAELLAEAEAEMEQGDERRQSENEQ